MISKPFDLIFGAKVVAPKEADADPGMKRARLAIIEDHPLYADALGAILMGVDDIGLIEYVTDKPGFENLLGDPRTIDLVLLDLTLPDLDAREVLERFHTMRPDVPVVIISGDSDPLTIAKMLNLGARGFIPKTTKASILVGAIKLVLAGGTYVPPSAVSTLYRERQEGFAEAAPTFGDPAFARLTPRQATVIAMLAEGCSNKEIARRLDISIATVKLHVNAILKTIDAHNRTEAALRFMRERGGNPG